MLWYKASLLPMHSRASFAAKGSNSGRLAYEAPNRPFVSEVRNVPSAWAVSSGIVIMIKLLTRVRRSLRRCARMRGERRIEPEKTSALRRNHVDASQYDRNEAKELNRTQER